MQMGEGGGGVPLATVQNMRGGGGGGGLVIVQINKSELIHQIRAFQVGHKA